MSNPFSYAELHTQDPAAAKAFYRQLFDWKLHDHENADGTYTEIDPGDGFPGGLLRAAASVTSGSAWMPYMRVDDVAAASARAKKLGARPVKEGVEIPEGVFSMFVDPTGAPFGLFKPSKR
jgi:predicted enzyme related to lactoylglutathione lyase